tara:strand:+ start:1615 stop:2304 length:690 start_codon:yes stop_codon:yes gene_type:complete
MILRSLIGAAALSFAIAQSSLAVTPDPVGLYGEELRFSILRNGKPVGSHIVRFRNEEPGFHVSAESKITVRFLGLPVYKFHYRSDSAWLGGRLLQLAATTDDNGDQGIVEFEASADGARVSGPNGTQQVSSNIIPTDHWHHPVVNASQVLNTLTGKINEVAILDLGWEDVLVAGELVRGRRHAYVGDLQTDVWYDADGRWVRMQFNGSDGSVMEYRCDGWSAMRIASAD